MIYEEFTGEVLNRFPSFRKYYLYERNANEIDLLPSNLEFDLIQYFNETSNSQEELNNLVKLLRDMESSSNEDMIMLYNETLVDIQNASNLSEKLKDHVFNQKDPHPNHTPSDVRSSIIAKKITLEERGKQYEENNKTLLEKYKKNIDN